MRCNNEFKIMIIPIGVIINPTYLERYGSDKSPNKILIFPSDAPITRQNNTFRPNKNIELTRINNPQKIPPKLVIIGVVTI